MASDFDRLEQYLKDFRQQFSEILGALRTQETLARIELKLTTLEAKMAILDPILEKVTEIETKADSLITLVNGLAQLLRDNAADPAAINEIANRLSAQSAEIQAAIDANTPPTP